jgi:quinol monooxygenase YgiN
MDDLKAHGASEHMKAYGAKNKDLVANRAVHVLQNA